MKKIFICITLTMVILFSSFCNISLASDVTENIYTEEVTTEASIDDLTIYSDCILMIEADSGDVLFERNGYEKMYPASTTKILTAILVLENCDLDEIATVSSTAINAVPATYTTSNIQIRRRINS